MGLPLLAPSHFFPAGVCTPETRQERHDEIAAESSEITPCSELVMQVLSN
jgi:hypothetical protein